jgi:hypothetical protein
MSIIYPWPIAFMKQWIVPLSYVVGLTVNGNIVNPEYQFLRANLAAGIIDVVARFSEPIVAMYGFSYVRGYYSGPLVAIPYYPTLGVFLRIKIEP